MRFTNLLVIVGAAALLVLLYANIRKTIRGEEGLSVWQIILLVISAIGIIYPVYRQLLE